GDGDRGEDPHCCGQYASHLCTLLKRWVPDYTTGPKLNDFAKPCPIHLECRTEVFSSVNCGARRPLFEVKRENCRDRGRHGFHTGARHESCDFELFLFWPLLSERI